MPMTVRHIPHAIQHQEPWANGAGSTTVILREPDDRKWRIRISVASVDHDGPFSSLPDTRRTLVPLDASMTLRFPDGRELRGQRLEPLRFDGAPPPTGLLPDGPTHDFNLMLRGDAGGEVLPRTLANSMVLLPEAGVRWLLYLHAGQAALRAGDCSRVTLVQRDAALVKVNDGTTRVLIEGAGEIVLVRLYACGRR